MNLLVCLLGLLYASFVEWFAHRFLFHGLGRKKNSFFAFHLREHHKNVLKNDYYDIKFSKIELPGILLLLLLHSPILYVSVAFYVSLCLYGVLFIIVHNIIHKKPDIGKRYFTWHWNHHMSNQNKSWGVVCPIFDMLAGTLEKNNEHWRFGKNKRI